MVIKRHFILGFSKVPTSPNGIKTVVMKFANQMRNLQKESILKAKSSKEKFSLIFDEWTSNRNRRYINIILNGKKINKNLGLVRISGRLPAEKCLELVRNRIDNYELNLERDILCLTTDGASVMTKIGKISPTFQQLCLAHGIQLAIIDVL